MFLNIQTQFYSTYCPVIQSESYKSVQVESKSLFYSFPYGLPSTQLVIAARPLLPPTPITTPWNCSVLRSTPLFSLSHGLHSLGTESTSRPLTVPFQRARAPPGHMPSQFLPAPLCPHTFLFCHIWSTKPHPGPRSSSASSPPAHQLRSHTNAGATERSEFLISSLSISSPFLHSSLLTHLWFAPVNGLFQIISKLFECPNPFYLDCYFIQHLEWPGVRYLNDKPLKSLPTPRPPASRTSTDVTFRVPPLSLFWDCILPLLTLPRTVLYPLPSSFCSPWASNYSRWL